MGSAATTEEEYETCELKDARAEKLGMRRGRGWDSPRFPPLRALSPAFSSVDVQTACASERPLSSLSVLSAAERESAAFEGDALE